MGRTDFLAKMILCAAASLAGAATFTIPTAGTDAAIQTALASARDGDTLFFPAGRYSLSKTITPKTGLVLAGAGASTSVLAYAAASVLPMVSLTGVSRVEVRDLGFEGGHARNAIAASDGGGHLLHHLRVVGFTEATGMIVGIHFTSKVTGSRIADNAFSGMAVQVEFGGAIRLTGASGHNQVLRNTVDSAGRGGIHLDGSPGNVISGNTVRHSGLAQAGTNPGLGLEVWGGCDSSLIEDNILDHWLSVDNSGFTAVRRNRIGAVDGTYKWAGLEQVGSSHCVFTGNVVDDGAHIGISLSNKPAKDETYWGFNEIRRASTWAMQMQGEEKGANRHFFYGNTFAATPGAHPQAIYTNQGHALRFNGNCFHLAFDSNAVTGNGGSALDFMGALEDLSFTRNSFSGNGGLSTGAYTGSVLRWENNSVTGAGAPPAAKGLAKIPQAAFSGPLAIKPGETAKFTNQSRTAAGAAMQADAKLLWDFGDGLPSNLLDGAHSFSKDGTFRVTLIVWETDGQGARAERTIVVGTGTSLAQHSQTTRMRSPGFTAAPARRFDLIGRRRYSGPSMTVD